MMTAPVTIGFVAVGDKGFHAVSDAADLENVVVRHVVTYDQAGADGPTVEDFDALAEGLGAELSVSRRPEASVFTSCDLFFAVGWQFLIPEPPPNLVVLHDSLLPKYRGFAPTVAALIEGDPLIGVTAILPAVEADVGDVLAQSSVELDHPVRIAEAFDLLRPCYRSCIDGVVAAYRATGLPMEGIAQSHQEATYAEWRGASDYLIDWSRSADQIHRQVLALGPPYEGAQTFTSSGERVIVVDAVPIADRPIVQRTHGKVLATSPDGCDVVCGQGVLRLVDYVLPDRQAALPLPLRTRFTDLSESRSAQLYRAMEAKASE